MQSWFQRKSRAASSRADRKGRRSRSTQLPKFDALSFAVERLEDRMLLAADLTLDKTVAPPGDVTAGTLLTYTITASNTAGGNVTAATGVQVSDSLPVGETFVDATVTGSGAPTVSNSGNSVTATLGTLNPGDTDTITIQALVTATSAGTLTNTATMTNTSGDTDPSPASATNNVLSPPAVGTVDLSVTKTAGSNPATVGSTEVYTVVVKNNEAAGGTNATGVTLIDTLPANATNYSSSAGTIAGNVLTDDIGNLAAGASATISVTLTPSTSGVLVNAATVGGDQADPTPGNNVATTTTPVGGGVAGSTVDLSVTKTAASNPATVNTPEVYTVVVTNNSTTTNATGVTLVDTLPANATSYTTSAGLITGNVLTDAIGNLAAGASQTITVSVTPTASGVLVNSATVAGDQVDSNLANNTAATTTPVGGGVTSSTVDLSVTKTAASNPATVGTPEVYTVVVTNNSTTTGATGVTLIDTLPANASSYTSSAGTITGNVLTDAIGSLPAGASTTVTVSVTPTVSGVLVNTATVSGDQVDSNLANNTATVATPVGGGVTTSTVDLSVTKTAASNPATVGTPEVYTVVVTNNSTTTNATGVTLVDTLPANATNYGSSAGTITGNVLTDSIGSLVAGASRTITVSVTPTAGGVLVNSATVTGDQVDSNPVNNTAATTTPVGGGVIGSTVDLSVTKTAASNPATIGTPEVYTVVVTNNSTTTGATGVTLIDTLPANATSYTSSAGTIAGNVLTDAIGNLAAGASQTITVSVTPTASGVLVNTATVAGDQIDSNLTNNTATVATPVGGGITGSTVDLSVTKTAASNPATVGTPEVYTVVVTNNSTTAGATGVILVDTLPANASNYTSSAGTITGNVLTDSIGTLLAGGSQTITVSVTPTASGVLVNSATVTGDQVDSNLTNNTATTTTPVGGGVIGSTVDLSVTKTAASNPATVGTPEVYTVVVTNNSTTVNATGVTLIDTLPANATSYTSSAGTIAGNVLTDSIGNLAAGASQTITVSVTPTANGVLINTATVAGDQLDSNLTNNTATVATPVGGSVTGSTVDLSVTKTAANNPATVGTPEAYTVVVKNNSTTTAATGVTLVDTLPANATSFTSSAGTITGNVLTDSIGNLAAGASTTITVSVTPTASGVLVNTATVTGDQVDNNLTNNTAATTTAVGGAVTTATVDLSVTKTAASNPATVGTPEVYTVVVKNNSTTTAATGVTLVDTLPANASGYTSSAGTITGNVLSDPIGNLAAGASTTITVSVTPTATGVLVNAATVAGDQVDNNLANNTATTTTPVGGTVTTSTVDLSVTKTAATNSATVGTPEVYTVVVKNNSTTTAATGVNLIDTLPANATSYTSSAGTISGNVLTDAIGNLAAGASQTITVSVTPTASGVLVNTATVAGDQVDSNLANNAATTTTPVGGGVTTSTVDLSVTKTAGSNPATVGTPEIYTVVVTNNSTTTAATGVNLVDTLPTNATSYTASAGTISGNVLTDAIGNLAAGASTTITVSLTPTATGVLVNTATVAGDQVDNVPTNNTATTVTPVNGGITSSTIDLSVTKTAGTNPAIVNQPEVYTIVVTNNSTTAGATGVTMADTLPANATFVSATDGTSGGSLTPSGGVLIDSIGSLAAGATDTITVTVTPTATGTLVNTASVTGDQVDSNTANNSVTVSTPVQTAAAQANLSITKTASPTVGTVGQDLTYTITVTNAAGAASAAGVTVVDALPSNVTFVSAIDNTSNTSLVPSGGTLTDNIGNMAAGSTDTITVVVTPNQTVAGSSVTNTASVTTSTSNSSTNTVAQVTTQIQSTTPTGAVLSISKTASASGSVGQNLTYTIIVSNTGGSSATGTTMTDTLPAGLTFVSAIDQTLGTTLSNNNGTVTDNIGTLAAGASDTIVIVVTPTSSVAGTTVTNTASVSSPSFNGGVAVTASAATSIATVTPTGLAPFLAGVPGDGTAQTFITNLYRELLGREPDSGGMSFYLGYLADHPNAAGQAQVVQAFLNSQEYKIHYVDSLYEVFLNRAPDTAGLNFWVQLMGDPGTPGGHSGSADEKYVLSAILGSQEFYLDSGNTPQGWINALYEDLLGRAPDGSGSAFWMQELQTRGPGDRDGIVRDLLTTPEAAHILLDTFYPAPGGTAAHPLAAPGTPAGTGSTDLALMTGAGWDNLYFEGPYGNSQEGNDAFFAALAGGASWDDVQLLMLDSAQYYSNPNRPVTD
ncbi:MAG TPA: DUF4214 domain-containing protein [Pirellulales bacterium]|nr:DUF4214 domain-containing protein [Pirellulales bacterium]